MWWAMLRCEDASDPGPEIREKLGHGPVRVKFPVPRSDPGVSLAGTCGMPKTALALHPAPAGRRCVAKSMSRLRTALSALLVLATLVHFARADDLAVLNDIKLKFPAPANSSCLSLRMADCLITTAWTGPCTLASCSWAVHLLSSGAPAPSLTL